MIPERIVHLLVLLAGVGAIVIAVVGIFGNAADEVDRVGWAAFSAGVGVVLLVLNFVAKEVVKK
jgi:small-conductance mechanosensitive channel